MNDYVNPDREQFTRFRELERAGPVHMLNLVKLKETAVYDDGTRVSGKEAYAAYGRDSSPIFKRVGGCIFWSGMQELVVIGPSDEKWDIVFIAEYPNAAAFVEMVKDREYQKAVVHRTAAVKTSRLIRLKRNESNGMFG